MRNHLRTVPVSPERRQVEMKHEPGARGTEDSSPPVAHAPDSPPRSVPKVGLEPTPSCEDRILSPARLPFRHFGGPLNTITEPPPGDKVRPSTGGARGTPCRGRRVVNIVLSCA